MRETYTLRSRWPVGVTFSLPLIAGLALFFIYPVVASLYYSLTEYPIFGAPKYVGLANYRELAADPLFWRSLWNTLYFAIFAVPLGMVAGLLLAMLLNMKVRGMAFYRTMFFLPSIVPLIATCVLWSQILSPQNGLFNELLRTLGLPEKMVPGWLSSELWAKPGLIIMAVWGCGGGMVLYLAALQDVPQELYESAALDGANSWHRTIHITLPMISPVLLFNLVMGLIGSLQYWAQAFVLTNGGPNDATQFYALHLFNSAFIEHRLGYARAMAWVLFAIILLATLGVMKLSNRYVYYHS